MVSGSSVCSHRRAAARSSSGALGGRGRDASARRCIRPGCSAAAGGAAAGGRACRGARRRRRHATGPLMGSMVCSGRALERMCSRGRLLAVSVAGAAAAGRARRRAVMDFCSRGASATLHHRLTRTTAALRSPGRLPAATLSPSCPGPASLTTAPPVLPLAPATVWLLLLPKPAPPAHARSHKHALHVCFELKRGLHPPRGCPLSVALPR